MDAKLAVGPVVHGSPAQPVSLLESPKHALHGLLAAVGSHHLLGSPVQAVGQQRSSAQPPAEKPVEGRLIEVELEAPAALFLAQLITNEPGQELARQPALNLISNLVFPPVRLRLIQLRGQ